MTKTEIPTASPRMELRDWVQQTSLYDAYVGSLEAKEVLSRRHLSKIIDIFDATMRGDKSVFLRQPRGQKLAAHQAAALHDFVDRVTALGSEREVRRGAHTPAFESAVRTAYRAMIEKFGVERINPAERGGVARYDLWFKLYLKSFPIRGERETKADMRTLLSTPPTGKGYSEFAIGLCDPLTGLYIGGAQGLVVSEARAGMNVYAFLDPATQGFGFSRVLHSERRKIIIETATRYQPDDTRPVLVFFEKNKLSEMSLENIVLDSAGIDILSAPQAGDQSDKGAISQSRRDATWSALGAMEIDGISYIQPSLDGVTKIRNPRKHALALRYLQDDSTLKDEEKVEGAKAIGTALGHKAAYCPLALCVYPDAPATNVDAKQVEQFLTTFYRESCLATNDEGLREDIFAQATLGKLAKQAGRNGKLSLKKITPYGGPFEVNSFADAELVTRTLLRVVPFAEVKKAADAAKRGAPETTYRDWLRRYEHQIRAELG